MFAFQTVLFLLLFVLIICASFSNVQFNLSFLFIFLVQLTVGEHNEGVLANLKGNLTCSSGFLPFTGTAGWLVGFVNG